MARGCTLATGAILPVNPKRETVESVALNPLPALPDRALALDAPIVKRGGRA